MTSLALAAVLQHDAVTAATVGVQHADEWDALVDAVEHPLDVDMLTRVRTFFA